MACLRNRVSPLLTQLLLSKNAAALSDGGAAFAGWITDHTAAASSGRPSGVRSKKTNHHHERIAQAGPPAFVLDIDGCLMHGREVLPAARRALALLYTADRQQPHCPLVFLTNGGGLTEEQKAQQLSELFDVHVSQRQVVLSHTPLRCWAQRLADVPVLVSGRGLVADVARSYGFKKLLTPRDIVKAAPEAVPFFEDQGALLLKSSEHVHYRQPLQYGTEATPIRAIFVMTDPNNWYLDLQLLTDVILGKGVLGRRPEEAGSDEPGVEVVFSNPDMLWQTEWPAPRFGQGAFAACLGELHQRLTGRPLEATFLGKPSATTYQITERLLVKQAEQLGLLHVTEPGRLPFSGIYAIGDNPASDVAGANAAGAPWVSVLVTKTGVARENCSTHPAQVVVDDVEGGVQAGLNRSRSSRWHSMR